MWGGGGWGAECDMWARGAALHTHMKVLLQACMKSHPPGAGTGTNRRLGEWGGGGGWWRGMEQWEFTQVSKGHSEQVGEPSR